MTDDERFKRWGERIWQIHEHIMYAIVNRRIHDEVGEILQANPRLWRDNNSFFVWIANTYEDSVLMAVRRQIDLHRDKPISLAWLLKEIITYPHILSRERFIERFVSRYSPASEGAANCAFDHFVAPGANHINPDIVSTELNDLREQTKLIEEYIDKRVAHLDAKGPKDSPTVLQVHNVLNRLHELRAKYMYLLRAERWAEPELPDETTWKRIFREPWIL